MRLEMTPSEREQAAGNWRQAMAGVMERRTGPRAVPLEPTVSPATRWDPRIPGTPRGPVRDRFVRSAAGPGPLPERDEDIAFATVTALSRWIETRALASERLTRIYLERIERFDPKLKCVITLTRDLALEQARRADADMTAGKYCGPLHGVPSGAARRTGPSRTGTEFPTPTRSSLVDSVTLGRCSSRSSPWARWR